MQELFKHFFPDGVDHKEILRILSSPVGANIAESLLKMVEEVLNEYYITRPCKKKSKTKGGKRASGNCAMISHKTNKQKACYDDCKTARAATHGGVSEGEEVDDLGVNSKSFICAASALEEEELEEISAAGGGAVAGSSGNVGGYSLPLGAKPSFFKDERPEIKGTMPGIKLIYKRSDKRN